MNLFIAPQVIINEDTHPVIAQTLAFLAVGGGRDEIGMGDWLAANRMRINISPMRYQSTGEMAFYDDTLPNNWLLSTVTVEFASIEHANLFIARWS